jgi:hypothetical protein
VEFDGAAVARGNREAECCVGEHEGDVAAGGEENVPGRERSARVVSDGDRDGSRGGCEVGQGQASALGRRGMPMALARIPSPRARRGSALVEFSLAGIPLVLTPISTAETACGMWVYHSLAVGVASVSRHTSTRGAGCGVVRRG